MTIDYSRRSCNNIAVVERTVQFLGSNETTCVGNISHQEGPVFICCFAKSFVIDVARIGRGTADNEPGFVDSSLLSESDVVNEVCLRVQPVWKRLEIDRRGSDFLLGSLEMNACISEGEKKAYLKTERKAGQ